MIYLQKCYINEDMQLRFYIVVEFVTGSSFTCLLTTFTWVTGAGTDFALDVLLFSSHVLNVVLKICYSLLKHF